MLSEPISMLGADFVKFAESQAEIWSMAQGAVIQHENFGSGEIEAVQIRKGYIPLITIKFCTNSKIATFNSDAFKSGKITEIKVPHSLLATLVAWKKQLEINAKHEAEVEAEKLLFRELEALASAERTEDLATRIDNPPFSPDIHFASSLEFQENYQAVKRAHYAGALPSRIRWLNKWSERIKSGAAGLEPAWSRGKEVSDYLRDQGIDHLWHLTDIRNLEGIHRERGLLSWAGVSARGIANAYMVADDISRSCDERLGREHFVRLSFIPNSWFFHRVRGQTRLVWMRFSMQALSLGEVFYSFGNAASGYVSLQDDLRSIGVNWETVKSFTGFHTDDKGPTRYPSRYMNQEEDPTMFKNERDSWNSEVLIKHFLPVNFCTGIFDSDTGERLQTR